MKTIFPSVFITFLIPIALSAQPLIFNSGFEPNTAITEQNSEDADIVGSDLSFDSQNDWVSDLESHANIGEFNLQYQGGNDTMRLAEIASDPEDLQNKVLWFWIKYPNVEGKKGRIQGNLYRSDKGFENLSYSIRLYIPHDIDTLKYLPVELTWFTLMEFWNNPGWIEDPYPFRITVNLRKKGILPDSLRFGAHGQTFEDSTWHDVWDTTDISFCVPTGKWMTLEINYVEGDSSTGRFYLAVTPEGNNKTVVFDLAEYTHHPSDPNPDGLTYFNPFKLYTSNKVIDSMRTMGKLVNVFWDDFKIWEDGVTNIKSAKKDKPVPVKICSGNYGKNTVIEIDGLDKNRYTMTFIDLRGREVRSINDVKSGRIEIKQEKLSDGVYFYRLGTLDGKCVLSGKVYF